MRNEDEFFVVLDVCGRFTLETSQSIPERAGGLVSCAPADDPNTGKASLKKTLREV